MPKFSSQTIWSRGVIIAGLLVYTWYVSITNKETIFALQKHVLQNRRLTVKCDKDFSTEVSQYPGCIPKECGRIVSDKIVTANEAEILLNLAKKGNKS